MRTPAPWIPTALCLSLALGPAPLAAFAQQEGHCAPGDQACLARQQHKRPGKGQEPGARPAQHGPAPQAAPGPAPGPEPLKPTAQAPKAPRPAPAPQPPRPAPQAGEPVHRPGPKAAPVQPLPKPVETPQPGRKPAPQAGTPAPLPGPKVVPVQPPVQAQPKPAAPAPQAAPLPRAQAQPRPAAPVQGAAPGPGRRQVHIGAGDVPDSRHDAFRPGGQRAGLTDFEKFGLAALAGAVVGALLSNGNRVVGNEGGRVVYRAPDGRYGVYHDDDLLLRRPGAIVTTETYPDGTVLTRVVEPDGTVITTLQTAHGRMLRRIVERPYGRPLVLFDDTRPAPPPPVLASLPPQSQVDIAYTAATPASLLLSGLSIPPDLPGGQRYALEQVRTIPQLRALAPEVEIESIDFPSGSSAIAPEQAQTLFTLAQVMNQLIRQDPGRLFLIEGHTDAVGDPAMNLALSDARAEALALALTEYFGVPPQNLVTQGYGAAELRVPTAGPEPANRRLVLRDVTGLLAPGQ